MNNGIAQILAQSPVPVFSIFGNNDGDRAALIKTALNKESNLHFGFSTYDFLEIAGKKVFLTHYPLLAKPMAKSGDFDVVFYGHDHKMNIELIGNCLIVNPGEISAHKTRKASFAIWDTLTNKAEIIDLQGSITTRTEEYEQYVTEKGLKFNKNKTHQY